MGLKKKTSTSDAGFISQIIFPNNVLDQLSSQAFLVGWNLENFRCTIACLVELPHEQLQKLESSLVGGTNDLRSMMASCASQGQTQPVILGEILRNAGEDYVPSAEKQAHSIWITLTLDSGDSSKPQLLSLYSLGCKYDTSCYMFSYDPANASELECYHVDRRDIIACEIHDRQRGNSQSGIWLLSDLHLIVSHLNTAQELHNRVQRYLQEQEGIREVSNSDLYYTDSSPFRSKLEKYTCTIVTSLCLVLAKIVYVWCAILRQVNRALNHKYVLFQLGTGFSQWLGLSGSGGIESGAYSSSQTSPSHTASTNSAVLGVTLRDLSLTGAYLAERSSRIVSMVPKFGFFPHAWLLPPALKQHMWIDVHNYLCLLWLDMILGVLFGYVMYSHAEQIVRHLQQECAWVQTRVIFDTLEWFNNSPGGVKLNSIITRKFGSLIIAAVKSYGVVMAAAEPLHMAVIRLIACFGTFGFTVQLVLIVDISRILTLHIALIHRALSYLHEFLLQCLHTLWLLYLGQKKNILRKRIDTCRFGQDQLLFGIVIFSILFFVFPSFAAYYFLFALAQLCCVAFQYVVYSLSVVVKECPYYEMYLYVLRPAMQSDGVQFKVLHNLAATATVATAMLTSSVQTKTQAPRAKKPQVLAPQRTERTAPPADTTLPVASPGVALGFGELRGILKSSDPAPTASASLNTTTTTSPATAPATGAAIKGRVSFQSSTVRTFPLYHSDENSPNSGEGSDDDQERVPVADVTAPLLYRPDYVLPDNKESAERLSGMQQWNKLMSLQQPLQYGSADARNTDSSANGRSGVAYIELTARVQSKARLFSNYLSHITYLSQERGIAERLLRGVVYGRPALDIQLIHGTSDISDQRESGEQAVLDEIVHISTRTETRLSAKAEQERINSVAGAHLLKSLRIQHGREGSYSQQFFACISAALEGCDATASNGPYSAGLFPATEEGAPLLAEPSETRRHPLSVLQSRQCRSKSRWMVFATLLTLTVHFVLCMLGVAVFASTIRISWTYQNRGVERSAVTGTILTEVSGEAEHEQYNSSSALPESQTTMRKLVLAPDIVPMFS